MQTTNEQIFSVLQKFVGSRPGFDYANYGDGSACRVHVRVATKQLNHAETMLAAVGWRSRIDNEALKSGIHCGFGGRLL